MAASSSEEPKTSYADEAKKVYERMRRRSGELGISGSAGKKGPCRVGFVGIARECRLLVWARDAEDDDPNAPVLSERFAALGRKIAARRDPPGWDDISDTGAFGGLRCISLPVCDLEGTTSYIVAFGTAYPLAKAQCLAERLALMLGPVVDQELSRATGGTSRRLAPDGSSALRELLEREIATANSRTTIDKIHNQVEEVRSIMEHNVEMILDRGEKLEDLEQKSDDLSKATLAFKKQARKLKRWHLMNQVKWGVAVGTLVTASVAIPITALALA
ncbi:hypothetical protein CTAYLR_008394 [Chrysophaeum taylorii]|uniref:V-SNARE coiled-coil homology domain-containing protein n=1 Tax=Chrysophaeum taylorii TaxID=2483200 RepID=A0AAD7UIY7_9STRA|nr:hypothetical protein CTAYLR_008394 [Chrysophaeum taylorii]